MKQLLKKAKAITILILMLSLIGCENDDNNLPKVIAGFTYTLNANTGTVTFINTSEDAGSYTWDFGDGGTSNEINPIKTYANGTYTVTLKASHASGASATFEDTIIISIPNPITFPVTFDDPNVSYEVATFSGASFEIIDNPDVSGTNDKATKVGAITNSGAAFEGINFDLGTQLDLTANKTITMNFWADAPVDVLMKLEQGTGDDIEVTASHGGTGWEVISFDFNSSNKYVRVTLFVDGPGTTAGTFYIDDIIQIETPPATCTPETTQSLAAADFNLTFQTDPTASIIDDGAVMVSVANPDPENDVNSSCQVGKVTRNPDFEYANNQIEFATKLDFNANAGFKMKVWTPAVGTKVTVKLEGNGATEVLVTTTKANEWEELTFDFASDESGNYDKIVLFFNIETNTPGEFYIDDFRLYELTGGGSAPTAAAPVPTRDAANVISIYNDVYTPISGLVLNPDWGQETVVSEVSIAGNNTQLYKGLNFQGINFEGNPQDISGKEFLHLDFWTANSTALNVFLISPGPVETAYALTVPTTGWSSVDIPLSAFSGVDLANVIQLKFDGNGDIYLDNIYFYGSGGSTACTDTDLVLPIDFDCEGIDYVSKDTGDVAFEVIDNPELSGINATPSKVAKLVFDSNQPWENMNLKLDTPISFATEKSVKLKLFSSTVRVVKLKFETGEAAVENDQNHTGSGWEELTFTLASAESYSNLVLFVDGGSNTVGTFYIDDIEQVAGGGGNGGECAPPPAGDLVSNGDFETGTDSCWSIFQNGGTAVLDNTISNGGSWSGKLVTNGSSNPAFKQERIGEGTVKAGDVVQITFDHIGSVVQPGAVFNVLLYGEGAAGASFTYVFSPAPVLTNSWTTFTGTFTIPADKDVTEGISFLIEAVCGGDAGCNVTANIDNVSVKLNP